MELEKQQEEKLSDDTFTSFDEEENSNDEIQ